MDLALKKPTKVDMPKKTTNQPTRDVIAAFDFEYYRFQLIKWKKIPVPMT